METSVGGGLVDTLTIFRNFVKDIDTVDASFRRFHRPTAKKGGGDFYVYFSTH